jgi:hypothetical protein
VQAIGIAATGVGVLWVLRGDSFLFRNEIARPDLRLFRPDVSTAEVGVQGNREKEVKESSAAMHFTGD